MTASDSDSSWENPCPIHLTMLPCRECGYVCSPQTVPGKIDTDAQHADFGCKPPADSDVPLAAAGRLLELGLASHGNTESRTGDENSDLHHPHADPYHHLDPSRAATCHEFL